MKYFGIPKCPYCKKRINIIRVWRLKKRGEYICPRCKGISNIFHSPLIYALALLCCAAGFLIYFFERYITDTVDFTTVFKVLIPFVIFYFFSLFMIYLEKPVIRKVYRRADGKMVDENGEVVHIAVNTILSSGGKKVKNTIKNPSNGEIMDLREDHNAYKMNDELIRRAKGTRYRNEENKISETDNQVKREPLVKESAPEKEIIPQEKTDEIKKTESVPAVKTENATVNANANQNRNETKYTEEELNKLEKRSSSGTRDNGQKTIRSRYQNESEFDEIFGATQEISDKRLKSAKVRTNSSIATPSVAEKKSEVKESAQTEKTEKREAKRFRDL